MPFLDNIGTAEKRLFFDAVQMSVSPSEFANFLRRCGVTNPKRVAIAVSGGPDSLALTLLVKEWMDRFSLGSLPSHHITAITCDHRARRESRSEAERVALWMSKYGIGHRTVALEWPGGEVPSINKFEEQARKLRYQSMATICRNEKIDTLLVGHHMDDQAETFLLRFARSSGIDGLASMHSVMPHDKLTILRPLLSTSKASLVETCKRFGQEYVVDPSNQSLDFDRNRVRFALEQLKSRDPEISQKISNIVEVAQDARRILSKQVLEEMKRIVHIPNQYGCCLVDLEKLCTLPERIAIRLLVRCLLVVRHLEHPPRYASLTTFLEWAHTHTNPREGSKSRTLSNCLASVFSQPHDSKAVQTSKEATNSNSFRYILFAPEQERGIDQRRSAILINQEVIWEDRFRIFIRTQQQSDGQAIHSQSHGDDLNPEFFVRRLQPSDLARNNAHGLPKAHAFRWGRHEVPREVLYTLPTIVDRNDRIIVIPHFPRIYAKAARRGLNVSIEHVPAESFVRHELLDEILDRIADE